MSFGIRLSLAFLLLLSTCFVYYAFKMDLTTGKYDIHTPLMKRAYNDSDADWVRNLLARKLPRQRPSHGTSSSHSPKCRDDGIVTRAWEKKGAQIEYGQTKDVYDITVTVGGEAAVIRFFPVIEKLEPKAKRIAELEHHVAAKQFIAWGREYIHKLDMEVWYVVEKKMGSAAEVWGKELKADIHSLQEEAREFYKSKRKLSLSPEFEHDPKRYVYWRQVLEPQSPRRTSKHEWHAEIVGWSGQRSIGEPLPRVEEVCIQSKLYDHD